MFQQIQKKLIISLKERLGLIPNEKERVRRAGILIQEAKRHLQFARENWDDPRTYKIGIVLTELALEDAVKTLKGDL